jgi:MFS family permease
VNRDFRLLWIGGLCSGLGGNAAALAVPLLVLAETGSPARAGLVGSASAVAVVASMLPGGALADAVERRRLMIAGQTVAALSAAVLAAAVLAGSAPLAVVLTVAVIGSMLSTLYAPAAGALLAAAVPAELLGRAAARLQARTAAARLAGPLLGGLLFSWSAALPFIAEAAGLLGSVACLHLVRTRSEPAVRATTALRPAHLLGGLRYVWRNRFLRAATMFFGAGLNAAFTGVMTALIASGALRDPSGGASSFVVAAAAAGTLGGALLAVPLRAHERPRTAMAAAGWTCTAAVSLLAFFSGPLPSSVLIAACLLVAGVGNAAFAAVLLTATPRDLIGRVQNAAGLVSLGLVPLGPLAGGALLEAVGHRWTFLAFAAVIAACATVATAVGSPRTPSDGSGGGALEAYEAGSGVPRLDDPESEALVHGDRVGAPLPDRQPDTAVTGLRDRRPHQPRGDAATAKGGRRP